MNFLSKLSNWSQGLKGCIKRLKVEYMRIGASLALFWDLKTPGGYCWSLKRQCNQSKLNEGRDLLVRKMFKNQIVCKMIFD